MVCRLCVEQLFPFNHLDDDNDFTKCIIEMSQYSDFLARFRDKNLIYNPFEINDDNTDIIEYQSDLDPDKHYFNEYSEELIRNCKYHTENRFNKYPSNHNISSNSFSVIHLNIRSLPANLSSFLSYLDNLDHAFSVIGLTETRLNTSNVSNYCIDGYDHVYRTRRLSKGVACHYLCPNISCQVKWLIYV